ncbi:N5,N10-methylene tetrahydromethanopterin reductase [Gordonia lacunae]|uniref:N5,N10-methylene tetrahydromethanopterin reductase n=1 Tax=Gordonia lacunae TaxID=417102 RepID=A0A243QCN9_9ACTN|nr:N5,N10-methylene tetrahydromethanopterin reductase [Gordonia lacunae]OUC79364.1 N5,N10-methylene tetrahydromethanopterin reductase [Gordonia lacunae]
MAAPSVGLGLSGNHIVQLLGDEKLVTAWDQLPLAFSVIGIDQLDDRAGEAAHVAFDGSAAAATLMARTTSARVLIAAPPRRDHPYNLARRTASLGHLSAGRTGVVFGLPRHSLGEIDPWVRGRDDAEITRHHCVAAARAVRDLEQSWPLDSVIGDRETGIFVRSDRIQHVDIEGVYPIAGPLTIPEPPFGPSALAWWVGRDGPAPTADVIDAVDVVLGAGTTPSLGVDEIPAHGVDRVVLDAGPDTDVADVLSVARRLLTDTAAHTDRALSLRTVLGTSVPSRRRSRPAFPVPQPHPWL